MKTSFPLAGPTRRILGAAMLALATVAPAWAQDYPTQPIRLIVSFPPGGAADVIGRTIATGLGEAFKQTIVVENRPGANGNIGADVVAKAAPDGYTLLMSSGGTITANPFLFSKMSFDPEKDLTPVASAAVVRPLPDGASVAAGEFGPGFHRLRPCQSGQAQLWLGRQRQLAASGGRDAQA
jgi:hypothetical protein